MLKTLKEVVAAELKISGPTIAVLAIASTMFIIAGAGFFRNLF